MKRGVVESLSKTQSVAITVAAWMSCATVNAHNIHNEENKQNHVLKTTAFNECYNEQHLSIFLHEVCYEWKFEGENPALVTDNARNTLPARAELRCCLM